jgi:hypothetical protein
MRSVAMDEREILGSHNTTPEGFAADGTTSSMPRSGRYPCVPAIIRRGNRCRLVAAGLGCAGQGCPVTKGDSMKVIPDVSSVKNSR